MNKERIREEFKQNFGYELMHKFNIKSGSLCEEITYFAFTNLLSIKGIRIEADNQDKPQNPYAEAADRGDMHAQSRCSGYYCAQDDMLTPKDGDVWVKCKVKEK